jgi:uncharacterized SAM-binding protein YcdF (DUF218 family)
MRRSVEAFLAQGLNIIPAPTAFRNGAYRDIRAFVPDRTALEEVGDAIREWLGILTYRLSYGTRAAPPPDAQGVVPAAAQ